MKRRDLLILAGAAPLGLRAQVIDIADAINKAGRQRMLSQRMGKAWLALVHQTEGRSAQAVLDKSMALFDRQLAELKAFAPSPEIRETYTALEGAWSDYKGTLVGAAPTRATAPAVLKADARVLALAHQGTQQYEAVMGRPVGKLVNVAGRQRMLSQRMAKFYQAIAWSVGDDKSAGDLEKARKEFAAAHQELASAPSNTPQIKDSLELVKQQWMFFENALNQKAGPDKRPQIAVATTSERILEEMETVVGLYEKLK